MQRRIFATVTIAALSLVVVADGGTEAQTQQGAVADFYRGKTITTIAGASAGGGIDLFARQLARHLPKHIPGNPQAVVTNMPGAGSKVAAKNIYAVATKDGTVMGTVLPGALMVPMRVEAGKRDYDPLTFNYLGNGNAEALSTVVRTDSGIASIDDLFAREMVAGTPGGGSSVHESTMVAKNLLGMKLKIVTGYPGVKEVGLAMSRGEVQGIVGLAYTTVRQFFPEHLTGAKGFKVIAQDNLAGHPVLNKAGVPLSISRAKSAEIKSALEFYQSQAVLVRVYLMPPGVPAARVAAVRKAFLDAIRSAEFQADVARTGSEAIPQSGEEVEAVIRRMYAAPTDLAARIAAATRN
jgi:tripartite-type tricarboxylate transporter receptor subunit TctC